MRKSNTTQRTNLTIHSAVPGSGKTTLIIDRIRIAYSEAGVPSDKMLIITFSRNMARELSEKLHQQGLTTAEASTFHSFCFQLIRQDLSRFGYTHTPRVLKKTQTRKLIKTESANFFPEKPPVTIGQLVTMFHKHDERSLSPSEILDSYQLSNNNKELIRKFMRHLYQTIIETNTITYQQMIKKVLNMLRSDDQYLKEVCGRYDCLFIDEYQDMNPVDQQLAKLLIKHIRTSMVVGDDMQNIYAFRGTKPGSMQQLIKENPRAAVIRRHTTYRLSRETALFVNAVLAHNDIDLKIKAKKGGKKPTLFRAVDRIQMYAQVTRKIQKLIAKGVDPEEIAVLTPFHFSLLWLTRFLTPMGIPFQIQMRKQYKDQYIILKNFKLFMKAVAGTDQQAACARLLKRKAKLTDSQASALSKDLTQDIQKKALGLTEKQTNNIRSVRNAIHRAREAVTEDGKHPTLHQILSIFNRSMVGRKGRYQQRAIENILKARGIHVDQNTTVKKLFSLIKRHEKSAPGGVTLSTIHSAKGGQWEHVLIIDLYDEILSKNRELKYVDYNDKLRQFYVAITRPSEQLHLFQLEQEITVDYSQNTSTPDSREDPDKIKKYEYKDYCFLPVKRVMEQVCKTVNSEK